MKVQGWQRGVERTAEGVQRVVDVGTKVFMDRSVLSPYPGDDLPCVGGETFAGAAGAWRAMSACHGVHLVRQVLFKVLDGRDLLGDFRR